MSKFCLFFHKKVRGGLEHGFPSSERRNFAVFFSSLIPIHREFRIKFGWSKIIKSNPKYTKKLESNFQYYDSIENKILNILRRRNFYDDNWICEDFLEFDCHNHTSPGMYFKQNLNLSINSVSRHTDFKSYLKSLMQPLLRLKNDILKAKNSKILKFDLENIKQFI